MTTAPAPPAARLRRAPARPWPSLPRVAGWLLLVACLLFVAYGAWWGERSASLDRLARDVATGRTHEVTVAGGLARGEHGFSESELRWRAGHTSYVARVVEVSDATAASQYDGDVADQVPPGVVDRLRATQPGLHVQRADFASRYSLAGWSLPHWTQWYAAVVMLLGLLLVRYGPTPWRATRWAWAWLILFASPIGLPAYLLGGGPTGVVRQPSERRPDGRPRRVLTGGWAVLLGLVLGSVVTSTLRPGP